MMQLCCNGASPASARLLFGWAAPTIRQPRHARRLCLLPGDVRRRQEAFGDLVCARVTGFGAAEPVGEHNGSCSSVCGRGDDSNLSSHVQLFPKHVSISPLRYSGSLRCYKSCKSEPVPRSANHAAGTPVVMTAGVARHISECVFDYTPWGRERGNARLGNARLFGAACLTDCREQPAVPANVQKAAQWTL
jgi:hypothetical protein